MSLGIVLFAGMNTKLHCNTNFSVLQLKASIYVYVPCMCAVFMFVHGITWIRNFYLPPEQDVVVVGVFLFF